MSTKRTDQENSGIVVSQAFAQGTAPTANDGAVWTDTSLFPLDLSRPTFRNKVINGDFRIAQRGTSFTAQTAGRYTLDRWLVGGVGTSTLSVSRVAGPAGVSAYAIRCTVGTAQASLSASDFQQMTTYLEGYDIHSMFFGTSMAKTLALSFWARSSKTGTYSVNVRNSPNSHSFVSTYTISQANTWAKYEIYITGATVGSWGSNHAISLELGFTFGAGTTLSTATANSWISGNYIATTSSTNFLDTAGGTFDIANVQLELDSFSEFERLPLALEQELCERYYQQIDVPAGVATAIADGASDTTGFWCVMHLPTAMRVVPSGTFDAGTGNDRWAAGARPDNATYGTLTIDNGATGATSLHIISLRLALTSYTAYEGGFAGATGAQVINKYVGLSAE